MAARTWNPTLDQLLAAKETLDVAVQRLQLVIENVTARCSQEAIDAAQNQFEYCLGSVFDACSSEAAFDVVARQAAFVEIDIINECEVEDAKNEERAPQLLEEGTETSIIEAAKMCVDRWDRDDRNSYGDMVLEALLRLAKS